MRHRVRHVQQTLADHLEAELRALGWFDDPGPFGAAPLRFRDVEADEVKKVEGTVVSLSIGEESPSEEGEVGGGVYETLYPLEVDVYAERSAIAMALASDVKAVMEELVTYVRDYTQTPPQVTDEQLEVEAVAISRPPVSYGGIDFKVRWRAVDVFVRCYHRGPQ